VRLRLKSGEEMVRKLLRALRPSVADELPSDGERLRLLVAESAEPVVLADAEGVVLAASAASGIEPGGRIAGTGDDVPDYEELRSGFTAVVSHELRTPLARLLALLETALLPDSDSDALVEQAREEVELIRELIDEVLFLSELETGREVVSLGSTPALPVFREVLAGFEEAAGRADVTLEAAGDADVELPLRPRMLQVVAENLTENALRYAGPGATFRISVEREGDGAALRAVDDGAGVPEADVGRLFERFYRADRARSSRGTGLGLAIVKHIVTSAGGTIVAKSPEGGGLEIRAVFPV
jgi:two-component system, OmpR family, phosphate regulon sensor histidine kinase PhoR